MNDFVFKKKYKSYRVKDLPQECLRTLSKYPKLFEILDYDRIIFPEYYSIEEALISSNKMIYTMGDATFPENISFKKEWHQEKVVGNETTHSIPPTQRKKINVVIESDHKKNIIFAQVNEESVIFQNYIKTGLLILALIIINLPMPTLINGIMKVLNFK